MQSEDKNHPIRRFDIVAHVGNDLHKKVALEIDVQKVMMIDDDEAWLPLYGVLRFYEESNQITAYHAVFNIIVKTINIYDMRSDGDLKYPYSFVVAE